MTTDTSGVARPHPRPLSDAVRVACLDQVNRALVRSSLIGIPASALLAWILGNSVPVTRRVAFAVFVSLADILTFVAARHYETRRKAGEQFLTYPVGMFGTGLIGLAGAVMRKGRQAVQRLKA